MNIISNKSEKSLSKRLTVVVLGLALIASGFVVPANTEAQSATSVLVQFNRDLTMGSTGTDVAALQTILIEKGFLNIPPGVAKGYFGPLTRSALARYQASVGIMPSVGYFGPITKAHFNSMAGVTPQVPGCPPGAIFNFLTGARCDAVQVPGCPPGAIFNFLTGVRCDLASPSPSPSPTPDGDGDDDDELSGGAGSISSYKLISALNNERVGEDEKDVNIAGLEIEASQGSDIEISAIRLVFDGGTATSDFDRYADDVSIWLDGEEVARVDASEFDDDNDWSSTVTLDRGAIIRRGDKGEVIVAISGIRNLDSADEGDTWTVDFRSVRFRDAQGATISEDPGTAVRTLSFESFAAARNAELRIRADDDSINQERVIDVHATDDTDNVAITSFTLEARGNSDLEITKFGVNVDVTGAAHVDDAISAIYLWIDGERVATGVAFDDADGVNVGQDEDYLFDDIDFIIEAGDTVNAEIRVDFNSTAGDLDEGDTIMVTLGETETDQANLVDVEDESGTQLQDADISGQVTAGPHSLFAAGINVTFVSSNATTDGASAGTATGDDTGIYEIVFDVTSFGDDVFIDGDVIASTTANAIVAGADGIIWGTTTNSSATTTFDSIVSFAILEAEGFEGSSSSAPDVTTTGALSYGVPEGETRRFKLKINLGPVTGDVQAGIRLRGISWDTDSGDTHDNLYNFNLGRFRTDTIFLNQQD
ncbi:MAG: hypothetical protein A3G52_00335 [Candidatus Taylorbacteria bacterium RIFCSPLOWO2_12_FULL_43_20]|uniref:Peptidoglycan binding-like domain-containing protein n=1 Tax=Candidatus Taylorbacteria bacterium RIFCSPLOWO2_12_FULL_43_20 TaxID=1802332 RepID=A0A1G2P1I5_9BACT|nr:MAG: hypothetical protein A2825_01730 [Candidatus Taylorbacteria bacterium RIFCSPHIGHO2_01_FULL_43_120]OHA23088.1 MAG: hypothetical protein A3B98_03475 [Candidatus Taylorbacteria bacterium RIFCSPHIGHO2_02_FULL_43_55]OHA28931.1 MAG: hypothetical protein A3E92_04655 [Candidatus Taylorbacteria bacterium RIFCSPHIGHO2_12_FULL_42_34]OHA30915.1 MAG: hypothetical protein A3B09_04605 [Candidatus Taylorbacteria bacterium RIFCSPLOWO2_01_FULL_43_83]OHA39291.1 MAG: hypothetical protein A3H58_03855 [Candi